MGAISMGRFEFQFWSFFEDLPRTVRIKRTETWGRYSQETRDSPKNDGSKIGWHVVACMASISGIGNSGQ